jgi:Ribonuclease G/E
LAGAGVVKRGIQRNRVGLSLQNKKRSQLKKEANMVKAKVRGIYSTALTKLLLDNGFEIVAPSVALRERFRLDDNDAPAAIAIQDRYDRHGIRTSGTREATDKFKEILQTSLDDAIVRKWPVSVSGIYKGLLRGIDIPTRSVLIDIGEAVGRVPEEEKERIQTKEVIVQVKRRRIGTKEPSLTTQITIPGRYAVLVPKSKTGVSLKIHDTDARAKLYALGEKLSPPNWSIVWRTAAATQSQELLEEEVKTLTKESKEVFHKAEATEAPALLREDSYVMDVELPAMSKRRLDEIRAMLCPTLTGHHYYKVCSGRIAAALEMAENLLAAGKPHDEVEAAFKQQIAAEYPFAGATVDVEHVKASGLVFYLGKASIESLDDVCIRLQRVIAKEGVYDGLDAKKEAGDVAKTEIKLGEWHFQTRYYTKDGAYKGCYVNFNTPLELYPHAVRYIDLEVDICVLPDGTLKVLDEEKLKKAVTKGHISEKLAKTILQKVQEARNRIESGKDL